MVYATNGSEAAVIYSYPGGGIEWVVGDVDGGSEGFGGERAAVVGYDVGNGRDFYMVPESSKDNISTIDFEISSNVGLIGQWIFDIGNSHCVNVTNNYSKLAVVMFSFQRINIYFTNNASESLFYHISREVKKFGLYFC